MTERTLDFWVEFASTYTYLAAQRIASVAEAAGVSVRWRPFLLAPIFGAQGWTTSPFNIYPTKGAFMFRDLARRCEAHGLPFAAEQIAMLPVNSVPAARLALAALESTARGPELCRAICRAHWGDGRDISSAEVLAEVVAAAGFDVDALSAAAASDAVRPLLRGNTEEAQRRGIFGAPSFTIGAEGEGQELFWGDDQLEDAVAWAATGRMAPRG